MNIPALMAALRKVGEANGARRFVSVPRTREDAEHAIAEDRAEQRRGYVR